MSARDVVVVNTLGGALQHYTTGLVASLAHAGGRVSVESVDEPSVAGGSGLAWVHRYVGALWSARRTARVSGARVVVTWPVLGHLDRLVIRLVLGPRVDAALVMHDPRPLVHARGYGRRSRRLGALGTNVRLLVHSAAADSALAEDCPGVEPVVLPHPVRPRRGGVAEQRERPVVRVLGQYKPDRDLEVLRALGTELGATHRLEIVGRRWPTVDGWDVTDEFVSEARLDELMATAHAVLVPYRRFFQSGIAIRSLELGTPAVGPAGSSIADLYPDHRYLAEDSVDSWVAAIRAAVRADREATVQLAERADRSCRAAWGHWLAA